MVLPTLLAPVTLAKEDHLMSRRSPSAPRAAPATEGLGALDRDRAASVADEGGATAAALETQDIEEAVGTTPAEKRTWRTVTLETVGAPKAWRLVSRWRGRT